MKLFKHPIRSIREPFGLAGVIVACVALVAALGGGAYAASGGLSGKQKKEVTKIAQTEAKKFAGKTGATGATGSAGPAGAAGKNGTDGTNGTNGTNGAPGAPGEPGKDGTFGEGTLPAGVTETGEYSVDASTEFIGTDAVSFPTPLAAPLDSAHTIYVPVPDGPPVTNNPDPIHCPGSVAAPTAAPGYLCAYESFRQEGILAAENNTIFHSLEGLGADSFGFRLQFKASTENENGEQIYSLGEILHVRGSWAVTGG